MKKIILLSGLITFLFIIQAFAQNDSLKLHYNFETDNSGRVTEICGNYGPAYLYNGASVKDMGEYKVLALGANNGYLDMGASVGNLIGSLTDFSISTYVFINPLSNLNLNGNYIFNFSFSDNVITDANGVMFFGAKAMRYAISKTNYLAESGIETGSQLKKGEWVHLVYTQKGIAATIYINGIALKKGNVTMQPNSLGATTKNYIGRSAYASDVYLKNALLHDFRIYNKALQTTDIQTMAGKTTLLNSAMASNTNLIAIRTNSNPIITDVYTADPAALVHNNKVYIYTGHDESTNESYAMHEWLVFSSDDMLSWTPHPVPLRVTDFSWAARDAWAGQVIERNGKFYWYICAQHRSIGGKAIGVAVADNPTGPFRDARGTALVTNNMTTQYTGISWDDIDPTVFIDDDGQAYMFWGNTQCYYAKLKENMIELDGPIMPVHLPSFTEAPWVHKRGDWYYLTYSQFFPEKTAYAMSKNINGPWEFKGILNEVAGNSNTNHHAIIVFNNQWYFVYHNGSLPTAGGSYRRSVCIDYLYYNEDGSLKRVQMTSEGVSNPPVTSVRINRANDRSDIRIYPNPAKGKINYSIPSFNSGNAFINIFDESGRKVFQQEITNSNGSLTLNRLAKGNYILNYTDELSANANVSLIVE